MLLFSSCSNTAPQEGDSATAKGKYLRGIDVSDNVGKIDWAKVKADGYAFAFVKATDGIDYGGVDYFFVNWPKMKSAGIIRGVYHFYESADDPVAQADYLADSLQNAGGLESGDLPPVLDFERAASGKQVMAFLKRIEARTGCTPIIYVDERFANLYLTDPAFANYPLWIAEYKVAAPKVPNTWKNASKSWTLWQDSESGTVRGVAGAGETDTNFFRGDAAALQKFIANSHR